MHKTRTNRDLSKACKNSCHLSTTIRVGHQIWYHLEKIKWSPPEGCIQTSSTMARWWFQPQFCRWWWEKNTLKPPPRWDKRTLPYLNKNLKRQAAWCFQLAFHPKLPPGSAFFRLWQTTRKPPNLLVVTFLGSTPELGEKLFGEVDLPGSPSLKLTGLRTWTLMLRSGHDWFPLFSSKTVSFREAIFQQLLFTSASGSLLRTLSTGPQTNN